MNAQGDAERPLRIVVVGAMGAGKSTIGAMLARRLGVAFADNDELLVRREGRDAASIAAADGMDELHRIEGVVVREQLLRTDPSVIAAAASVVTDDVVVRALARSALTVWLRGPTVTLSERAQGGAHRPMRGDVDAALELARRRDARYRAVADLTVDVSSLTPEQVTNRIVEWLDGS